jgi:hypothetical protein
MNAVKRQPVEPPPASTSSASGKLVIVAILAAAFTAAATSWYFRYHATHRAARFWGPEAAVLIRDAPQVTLYRKVESGTDVSHAPGLSHLRNALLEDSNFIWPTPDEPSIIPVGDIQYWRLEFHDPNRGNTAAIQFTQDCRQAARLQLQQDGLSSWTPISTEPISAGLCAMFAEFSVDPAAKSAAHSR